MNPNAPPLICLVGPTASGKSGISQIIARHLPVEIINVDSATIYRGMDIGTAKPEKSEQLQVRHHLLDILDPAQRYSAAQFRTDALQCAEQIRSRGHIPLLVGGTMLYIKVLRDGIDDLPHADARCRANIQSRAHSMGWPALHKALAAVDPITAARLAPNDSQRIGRALEVFESSGQPLSSLIGRHKTPATPLMLLSLEPCDRTALHTRIESRFDQMLEKGLVREVEQLYQRGDLYADLPSMRCVGYRQIWQHLQGDITLAQARDQGIAATRQLAKRQLTWLKSMHERRVVDCLDPQASGKVLKDLNAALAPVHAS